ncbi:MAG: kinase-like domain-containing protein [Benjaminiella poitrasii]|nr:MAG: kinase-like domain-containing protein [Benjaminiella poitrasii]
MKHKQEAEKSASVCPKHYNTTTRIPLPVSSMQQNISRISSMNIHSHGFESKGDETQKEAEMLVIRNRHKEEDHLLNTAAMTSRLKKPEVIVPKLIKRLPSNPIVNSQQRRPSFTTAQDILQDQLDREREQSKRLSANLISAQGLISQPDEVSNKQETVSPNYFASRNGCMDKIHDRLQCLVDVRISTDNGDNLSTVEHGDTETISGKAALNLYKACLSPYEKTEILRYPAVYCVGSHASKKHMATTDESALNYGFDDEKGDYKIVIKDHLNYRYEIIESLGKGSFGQVVKCRDHKLAKTDSKDSVVAVKIIRNKKRFHAQAQTEVKILDQLMKWDSKNKHFIVRMLDSFYFRDHLCIVFECLSLNLFDILQQNNYQGFSMGLVKRFAFQILTGLNLLSQHNIIHCDLKPENILLKQPDRSGIRMIDFGSSCYSNEKVYTYIQSRFYRAPEVILGLDYGLAIDMWSTGCILAELYTGRPLFPGENEPDQLACIMQLLGVPDNDYLDRCTRKKQFFDTYNKPRKAINSKGKRRKPGTLNFTEALRRSTYDNFDNNFADFICRCLTWEPEKRMKPIEALSHPWIQSIKK